LVFSLLPRCQGLRGSQKYTWTPVSTVNLVCSAISLPWSQVSDRRSCSGNRVTAAASAGRTCSALYPSGQRDQGEVAAGPLHQRHHRRWSLAQQQVAFPVARHRPILGLRRPLADQHDLAELTGARPRSAPPAGQHRADQLVQHGDGSVGVVAGCCR
jgi:hypothetical protein